MTSNLAYPEYDSTGLLESISVIPIVLHEDEPPYAGLMRERDDQFGFGERLKKAREAIGISQKELGQGAGRTPNTNASKQSIRDWEKGEQFPGIQQLRVLCLKLNISADELLFGDIKEELTFYKALGVAQELTDEQRQKLLATLQSGSGKSTTSKTTDDQHEKRA